MRQKIFVFVFFLTVAVLFAQSSVRSVYVTSKGKKYHTQQCRTIKNATVTAMEKEAAEKAGYTACKVCKP